MNAKVINNSTKKEIKNLQEHIVPREAVEYSEQVCLCPTRNEIVKRGKITPVQVTKHPRRGEATESKTKDGINKKAAKRKKRNVTWDGRYFSLSKNRHRAGMMIARRYKDNNISTCQAHCSSKRIHMSERPRYTSKQQCAIVDDTTSPPVNTIKELNSQETKVFATASDAMAKAIVPEGYPEKEITLEQLLLLRNIMIAEIEAIQEGPLPRFLGVATLKNGGVIIRCADEMSLRWLENRIKNISPWKHAKLELVDLVELQRRHKAMVWIPGFPKSAAAVLDLLERQNPGVGASGWRIFAENIGASTNGKYFIFGISDFSVRQLETLNYKLCYGIEQVTITVTQFHGRATETSTRQSNKIKKLNSKFYSNKLDHGINVKD